ncbi:DUF5064 family protein [Pseudomonas sp. 5P_3.1_Bac2]|uniref:DUF5064 family protein n=1 Tax=Pseudomonas sp. 5P_3.1_Bac2 TaxID=2971617 RepID=UPI0021C894B7|nr:DUF5064 family protein [Pseudomonas sp. 5P_3.1_Bac2]MCU1716447.1 DUF5064 family protein [Pseudomonas sp. 5P_3.1_Bac2]
MFQTGHWHTANTLATPDTPLYSLDLYYQVREDLNEGPMLHLRLTGTVAGKRFSEEFELHRDTAFNFASVATRIAQRHGLPTNRSLIMRGHQEYDLMFEDIRNKLGLASGEPVNLDHVAQDRV